MTMSVNNRRVVIDIIGDAPWGTHFFQFYKTKEDLLDLLVPDFKAGLENNEFCMWITSEPLGAKEAEASLIKAVENLDEYTKKGQIEILDYTEWYTKSGKFNADETLQGWAEKEKMALEKGFDGLRLSGNTFWLEKSGWDDFTEYEEVINSIIGTHKMMAVCTYSLDRCGISEVLDVFKNHQFALIRRAGRWEIIEYSERKQVEKALRESEENLKKYMESAPAGVYINDLRGTFLYGNKRAEELTGYPREELIGKSFLKLNLLSEKDIIKAGKALALSIAGKSTGPDEFELLRKDGSHIWVEINTVPLKEAGGKKVVVGFVRDITERKKAEEALRDGVERHRAIVEQAADSIVLVDTKTGELVEFNDRAYENLGYTRNEFRKLKIADVEVIESPGQVVKHIEKIIKDGSAAFDTKHKTKGGEIRDVQVSSRVLVISGRDFIQSVWRDVTQQKQAEAERRELERKSQITDRLASVGEMASGIAHEINNPLTGAHRG